jgi:aminoglycoside 3-N-acetyltransferase I
MGDIDVRRLGPGDEAVAANTFTMMAKVFGEASEQLTHDYLQNLLGRENFWALTAFDDTEIVGGLTAHALPMTRTASTELFIYDLAVRHDHRRQGVGSRLVTLLRESAARSGITEIFVPADNEDVHALDFYRAQGATASPVTIFTFTR